MSIALVEVQVLFTAPNKAIRLIPDLFISVKLIRFVIIYDEWRVGGAVTRRSAKPFRRVRLSYVPPWYNSDTLHARMAELVDARDLKSLVQKTCGFDSRSAHQNV